MNLLRTAKRAAALTLAGVGSLVWFACSDQPTDPLDGPTPSLRLAGRPDFAAAVRAQERHTDALLRVAGVVGTAVGLTSEGQIGVQVLVEREGVRVPDVLDGVPTAVQVAGRIMALSDPTTRARPAPLGYSVGHPAITAGTIGARVRDGSGNLYILSNNHVLANSNGATLGDPEYQPGPFDGGTAADQVATLTAFYSITFTSSANNTMDAAIAATTAAEVGNSTPTDADGYGMPGATIYGDANSDGLFDDRGALLGLDVQKAGRTTRLTHGTITGVNATVTVCYESFIICTKSARFVDQLIITPGTFSGGGDSGSLIVTDDASKNPVGLLFAGSSAQTIANRIDFVLTHFGVTIDAGDPPPPPEPLTDIGITNVGAPGSATVGSTVAVAVTVRNVGNQDVAASFDVTLQDATDAATIGTQTVAGLAPGASTVLQFSWNTTGASLGAHTLTASQSFVDENAANDQRSATVTVNAPSVNIHVGDLDAITQNNGSTWSATVEIAVHDANHNPLNGVTVRGTWSPAGIASDECVTGDLGGDGTCIVLFPSIRRQHKSVTFTVTSLTADGFTYQSSANHDPDGGSNGTSIKVNRP